jgi:hypothetical protein
MSNIFNILPNPLDDRSNIFNVLPKELWIKIITEYLNYKNVIILCFTSKQFKKLHDDNNISEIFKYRGFPRPAGHCNMINIEEHMTEINIPKSYLIFQKYRNMLLNELYDKNYDLVRGDRFCTNDSNENYLDLVFDGHKISDTHNRELNVGNGIPIDYWFRENIIYYPTIWLNDDKYIKDQCLSNIKKDGIRISTTFNYDDELYKIVGYNMDVYYSITAKNFKLIFSSTDMIKLRCIKSYKKYNGMKLEIDHNYYQYLLEY